MKRAMLSFCLVVAAVVAVVLIGRQAATAEVPELSSVSEAAFDLRRSGAEDVTECLVGNYTTEKGEKFCFSGDGEVTRFGVDLSTVKGQYTLSQTNNGKALLCLTLEGTETLYSFRRSSPEGGFTLTDSEDGTTAFTPVP